MGVIIEGGIQLPNGEEPKPFNFNTLPISSEGKHSTQKDEVTSGGSNTFLQNKSGAENTMSGPKKNSSTSNNSKGSTFLRKH